jgi:NTP pyrophosphatase (non-canonical NTP hydrolase)
MIDHYTIEARKTAIYPRSYAVIYPALGLCGETAEVWGKLVPDKGGKVAQVAANVISAELGDVLWYITNTAADADILLLDLVEDLTGGLAPSKFADLFFQLLDSKDKRSPYVKLTLAAGEVAEVAKKSLRDDQGHVTPEKVVRLRAALGMALRAWLEVCDKHKLCPDDVALGNVLKLKKRADEGKIQGDGDNR